LDNLNWAPESDIISQKYLLAILYVSNNENSHILEDFTAKERRIELIRENVIKDYLKNIHGSGGTSIQVVSSDYSGLGKSRWIKEQIENLTKKIDFINKSDSVIKDITKEPSGKEKYQFTNKNQKVIVGSKYLSKEAAIKLYDDDGNVYDYKIKNIYVIKSGSYNKIYCKIPFLKFIPQKIDVRIGNEKIKYK
jgi:hypothetical protein